jgi:hypothetical protein
MFQDYPLHSSQRHWDPAQKYVGPHSDRSVVRDSRGRREARTEGAASIFRVHQLSFLFHVPPSGF